MSEIWAIIVIAILVLIVYGIVSSKLSARRQREAREKMLPYLDETIVPDRRHNLFMSDRGLGADARDPARLRKKSVHSTVLGALHRGSVIRLNLDFTVISRRRGIILLAANVLPGPVRIPPVARR